MYGVAMKYTEEILNSTALLRKYAKQNFLPEVLCDNLTWETRFWTFSEVQTAAELLRSHLETEENIEYALALTLEDMRHLPSEFVANFEGGKHD
jgi:hypothetical protein